MSITKKSRLAELVEAEVAKEKAPGFNKSVWIKSSSKWSDLFKKPEANFSSKSNHAEKEQLDNQPLIPNLSRS